MRQILVIGIGSFGYTLATQLAEKKCEVVVIDSNREKIQDIKDQVTQAVVADASDKNVLEELGVRDVDVACVCLGEKIDVSILVTLFLKELGVKRIIAKATSDEHGRALRLVGATQIVYPEKDEAIQLAQNLVSPDVLDFIRVSEEFNIVEIAAPEAFFNSTLRELNLRKRYGVQVLAIRNPLDGSVHVVPSPDHKIKPDDVLIVIGETQALRKFSEH